MREAKSVVLEGVDVECTQCGVTMSASTGGGGTIQYFRCPKCQRWVSSMYTEVFRADAKVRTRQPMPPKQPVLGSARDRLEAWLKSLDVNNPYRVLGCDEGDSIDQIRDRYRALARRHHPDAGGDAATMRSLNQAWETIVLERQAQSPFAIRRVSLASSM